ncbi:MAG: deoxyhypusine synthase family protein [Acidobacteriota bacterium]|nr:deoxyhypusine synthase family protein [Acidobacteriota bacterium]
MKFPYEEFDLSGVRTYPLRSRESKARAEDFARPYVAGSGLPGWLTSLPSILAAGDFKAVVAALTSARASGAGIIWGLGAHVIKTGLSPVVIDLMERGFVSAIATNGAGIIHDFEVALSGATSEDVDQALGPGRFGMAEETGTLLNRAIRDGVAEGLGLGQSVGRFLAAVQPPYAQLSLVAAAARLDIPVTVHVAIGTDIIHMHPEASGAAIGEGSLRDFRYFTSSVARLEGGVYLNCGSAVILPEVFLKAVALARNQGRSLQGLTTVNLDFARLYRPQTNVVTRPTAGVGHGYSLVGHHELMIPLLAAALIDGQAAPAR